MAEVKRKLAQIDRSTTAGMHDHALLSVGFITGRRLAKSLTMPTVGVLRTMAAVERQDIIVDTGKEIGDRRVHARPGFLLSG
jgi:hypothetical protein